MPANNLVGLFGFCKQIFSGFFFPPRPPKKYCSVPKRLDSYAVASHQQQRQMSNYSAGKKTPGLKQRLSGKRGVRSVENAECRKCGVWKTRGVEKAECGKRGV